MKWVTRIGLGFGILMAALAGVGMVWGLSEAFARLWSWTGLVVVLPYFLTAPLFRSLDRYDLPISLGAMFLALTAGALIVCADRRDAVFESVTLRVALFSTGLGLAIALLLASSGDLVRRAVRLIRRHIAV